MKKLMMMLLTLVAANAFAAGADQEQVEVVCDQAQTMPDNNLHIEVISGGFTGLTRMELTESLFIGPRTTKFYVTQRQLPPNQANDLIIYNSKKVSLAINLLKKDSATGKFESRFTVAGPNAKSSRAMLCELK